MIPALQSALSGLSAFGTRLNSNGNNIANANTEEFKRSRITLSNQQPYGVRTQVEKVNTPGPMHYEQTNQGMELIEQSNVEIGEELPDMNLNARLYQANLKTVQTVDEMLGSLLKVKA